MAENQNSDPDEIDSLLTKLIGSRVVRGPDWKWSKQDGGEGHVGTLRQLVSANEALVVWDNNGTRANYRCSIEFDLRILDVSQCGVVHESVRCEGCEQLPLQGIRWLCADCLLNGVSLSLCSKCYHDDKHLVKHQFYRILTPTTEKMIIEPRKKSKKLPYRGIYSGAWVVQGMDWQWDKQSFSGLKGKVIEVCDWNKSSFQSGIIVAWDDGTKNLCRLGYNGMTDLKCIEDAKGGNYYKDHLPVLGEQSLAKNSNKSKYTNYNNNASTLIMANNNKNLKNLDLNASTSSTSSSSSSSQPIKRGVTLWHHNCHTLANNKKSTSLDFLEPTTSASSALNDSLLMSTSINKTTSSSLKIGDSVNIDLELERLQTLQMGHGGWCEAMFECLGNTGVITNVDDDNDFEVTYPSGNKWTFNPIVLKLVIESNKVVNLKQKTRIISHKYSDNNSRSVCEFDYFRRNNLTNGIKASSLNELDSRIARLNGLNRGESNGDENDLNEIDDQNNNKYAVNDLVEICNDLDKMKALQRGHGEWVEAMQPTLGQIGKITTIYPDNDLKVEVCGTSWTFNPLVVTKLDTKSSPKISIKDLDEEFVKAAACGDCTKCEYILSLPGSNVNCLYLGHTALHAASQNGHLQIIEILLKFNCDLELEDKDGDRAIHHAAFGNEPKVIEMLYSAINTMSTSTSSNSNKSSKLVGLDLNSRNKKRQTALHIAVNKGYTQVVKLLVQLGCHVNLQDSEGDTPLHDAISKVNETLVQILLDANADISMTNKYGFNCIHHSALRGNPNLFKHILGKVKRIQREWLVDEKKDDGFSALHLACLNNYKEIVALFLNFGQVDLNTTNFNLQTPLHLAVERSNYDIVRILLVQGADNPIPCDPNAQDKDGDTPLHCLLKNYSIMKLKKSNVLVDGKIIERPKQNLELIDDNLTLKMACLLIDKGASLYSKNKKLKTPIDLCTDSELIKFLIKYENEFKERRIENKLQNQIVDTSLVEDVTQKQQFAYKTTTRSSTTDNECLICSTQHCDTLLKPCNHMIACYSCSLRCKKCLLCKVEISDRVKVVDECVICSERPASVLLEPCGHVCACEKCAELLKKCIQCRAEIERKIGFNELRQLQTNAVNNTGATATTTTTGNNQITQLCDVKKLKQQLQEIKEQTMCPVCFDKLKNMVFLCGHSTCQMCGDQISECPICRKIIQNRILIY